MGVTGGEELPAHRRDAGVFHDFHHAHFQGNYAGFLAWFDRVMGTEVPEYTADRARREGG